MRTPFLRNVYQYNTGGVFKLIYTTVAWRMTSYGQSVSRRVLAWVRDIREAILEPKRASTPGYTRLPRLWVMYTGTIPVMYLSLHTPPLLICRKHLVRAKYGQACVGMV